MKKQSSNTSQELHKLKISTRNKVKSIAFSTKETALDTLNKLRKSCSAGELVQIEKAIKSLSTGQHDFPELFPSKPQTEEKYRRLFTLPLKKQLEILNILAGNNINKLTDFFQNLFALNEKINILQFTEADKQIGDIVENFGHSHLILRKAILINTSALVEHNIPNTVNIIENSGLDYNNHIVSSLIHCYQDEQDFLSIKRAIMNTNDKGEWNRYTRDILRIAFHPHAKNKSDLSEMIQSNLQSSLVDALILTKINCHFFKNNNYPHLNKVFSLINSSSLTLESIVTKYLNSEDPEALFYQQSSVWLENDNVVRYRRLQDHFYDYPDSKYFEIDDGLLKMVGSWVAAVKIRDLVGGSELTSHSFPLLKKMEQSGTITRSSIFNFIVHSTQGETHVSESELIEIMELTSALSRTINIKYIKVLANNSESEISKIILYLLIAKQSKNDSDNFKLRQLLQKKVIRDHEGKLTKFVSDIAKTSKTIAKYTYDVCSEDFIAKLSRVIKSSKDISETRASLHLWMGEVTGDVIYSDKAKNLLIDHQINLVKDELDDNRIYVDTIRFTEWMENEVSQELSTLLFILDHNKELTQFDEPQLFQIIQRCYLEFCSNKFFGIASYLGRRIRHGTFRGHLFSDVISIETEEKYKDFLQEQIISNKWQQWKLEYEKNISHIIQEKLHIHTSKNNNGFLNPIIIGDQKIEITSLCMKNIMQDFQENKQTQNSLTLIIDYCWRLAEVDLKSINSYLKNRKSLLTNFDLFLKSSEGNKLLTKDFTRDIHCSITEKMLHIYGWFKRPQSVSPRASLGLLYKAVVAEVNQTFRDFNPDTNIDDNDDIDMMGGAYHVIYDALYVIIYNAAKHGERNGIVTRQFQVVNLAGERSIEITVSSENKNKNDDIVNSRIKASSNDDIDNAQLTEGRSGIPKLYNLEKYDKLFKIEQLDSIDGKVIVTISYKLGRI